MPGEFTRTVRNTPPGEPMLAMILIPDRARPALEALLEFMGASWPRCTQEQFLDLIFLHGLSHACQANDLDLPPNGLIQDIHDDIDEGH